MNAKDDASDESERQVSILTRLPSSDTYRKLAAQLRDAARAKTDAYARNVMFKMADDYDQFAEHLEQIRAVYRPAPQPPSGESS